MEPLLFYVKSYLEPIKGFMCDDDHTLPNKEV